jgi:hypothetical protein
MNPLCLPLLSKAFLAATFVFLCLPNILRGQQSISYEHVVVDTIGPRDPWGKAVGDLNGDGAPDLIVGGFSDGGLLWYENPSWIPHVISSLPGFRTDPETGDVDLDGHTDVVSLGTDHSGNPWLGWFKNPDSPDAYWVPTVIDAVLLHDIEVADLDNDGRMDIVGRDQEAFPPGRGDTLYIYFQTSALQWSKHLIPCTNGEGLRVSDINRDARPDIVINGSWFQNSGVDSIWIAHEYTATYTYRSVAVDVADIDGDSLVDILVSPSERAGGRYRISWFKAPHDPTLAEWPEHVVEDDVETVHHSLGAADFDNNGTMDIASAKMNTGQTVPEVKVYQNRGQGVSWVKRVIATTGSHSMRVVDVNGNGYKALFGANWRGQGIDLWVNQSDTNGTVSGGASARPMEFVLEQNYPNPFNPSTTIRYGLPGRSPVTLTVFNALGQHVATLVQRDQEEGYHEAVFDASGLASGVYLYRLQAGAFSRTRIFVLLR